VFVTPVTGPVKSKPVLTYSSTPLYFVRSKDLGGIQYDRVQRMSSGMNADVEIRIEFYVSYSLDSPTGKSVLDFSFSCPLCLHETCS